MIQLTIDEQSPLGLFILAKAAQENTSPDEVARQLAQETFEKRVRSLHRRFMRGDFSQGALADLLGLPRLELIHLLEALRLSVTNV
jgi:hypothetical protein